MHNHGNDQLLSHSHPVIRVLLLSCIMSFLCSHALKGQELPATHFKIGPHESGDSVAFYMQKLTLEKVDTIIRLNLPSTHTTGDSDFTPISISNISFLFYVRNDSSFFVKYDWYKRDDGTVRGYFSSPEIIEGDTLFRWFSKNEAEINNWIFPFIYQVKTDSLPRYYTWEPLELHTYEIEWYCAETRRHAQFALHRFERVNLHNWINLNYPYNTSTRIFQLYRQLELICMKMDPRPHRP